MEEFLRFLTLLGMRAGVDEANRNAFYNNLSDDRRALADRVKRGELTADAALRELTPTAAAGRQVQGTIESTAGRGEGVPYPDNNARATSAPGAQPIPPANHDQGRQAQTEAAAREAAIAEGQRLERERLEEIREMAALAGDRLPAETVERALYGAPLANPAVPAMSAAEARRAFASAIEQSASPALGRGDFMRGTAPGAIVHDRDRELTRDVLAVGVMRSLGVKIENMRLPINGRVRNFSDDALQRLDESAQRYAMMSCVDIARECLRMNGHQAPHLPQDIIREAIVMERSAAISSATLSYVYTTSVNAQLLEMFEEAPDATVYDVSGQRNPFVREVELNDFKSHEIIRIRKNGQGVPPLPKGQPAAHRTFDDVQETERVYRYAEQISFDERDMIDDSLNVLTEQAEEMGDEMARLRPGLVFAILLENPNMRDSNPLFDASNHGNLGSSGTALDAEALEAAITLMGKQTENGVNLNLSPRHFVGPRDLKFKVLNLLNSEHRVHTGGAEGDSNPLRSENIAIHVDNRLGVAGNTHPYTGSHTAGTATNWFLFAEPRRGKTIRVSYLRGTGKRPTMRSYTHDKGQWGVGWDTNFDIGVAVASWEGCQKNTGEA